MNLPEIAKKAKAASILLSAIKTEAKNNALTKIAEALKGQSEQIINANEKDLSAAEQSNLAIPLLKRLKFDQAKINQVCAGIESLIKLDDPVGR